jgi:hypothetical protein
MMQLFVRLFFILKGCYYCNFAHVLLTCRGYLRTNQKRSAVQESGRIKVWNNGSGIPVEMHKKEGVYVPELIFGHLLTSSNYEDNQKKVCMAKRMQYIANTIAVRHDKYSLAMFADILCPHLQDDRS